MKSNLIALAISSVLIIAIISLCSGQWISCPSNWIEYQANCYKFIRSPRKPVSNAAETCITYNAQLLSVNSIDEHHFIASWLRNNDPQHRKWHTSGRDHGNNAW